MKSAMSEKTINSKSIAFVSMMSAIGTILALLSLYLVPLVGQQVALDLSHIGTYIVALSGGPLLGLITGALVGFLPSYRFANPAIIPGKMMTGIFIGLFYGLFQKITAVREKKYLTVIAIIVSGLCGYIPESIFTWWDLKYIVGLPDFYVIPIIIKAWVEIIVITVLMAIILNINYIKSQLSHLIGDQIKLSVYDYLLSAIITIPIFSITI
ncbi:MAG: ECF transporter S component [Candidatus Helarchaeota archaeon]